MGKFLSGFFNKIHFYGWRLYALLSCTVPLNLTCSACWILDLWRLMKGGLFAGISTISAFVLVVGDRAILTTPLEMTKTLQSVLTAGHCQPGLPCSLGGLYFLNFWLLALACWWPVHCCIVDKSIFILKLKVCGWEISIKLAKLSMECPPDFGSPSHFKELNIQSASQL